MSTETALVASKIGGRTGAPLSPSDREWTSASETHVELVPTPVDRQPSAYVQASWSQRERSGVDSLSARALVSDDHLMLRLEWSVAEASPAISDYNVFADACGVLFPSNTTANLGTMGSQDVPVTAWYWRAGQGSPVVLTARGLGTTQPNGEHGLKAVAERAGNTWSLVLFHPTGGDRNGPASGDASEIGFAVWSGAEGERAGLKFHTPDWLQFRVD